VKQALTIKHQFVHYIPKELKDRTIYISLDFATAVHKCCCGCGQEVVTPLSPTDWLLTFDGRTISLDPSIGNWSFACRSHYWILRNAVIWAPRWSQRRINAARAHDLLRKDQYYDGNNPPEISEPQADKPQKAPPPEKKWFA
jgi:hypothetical protein